jgi:quinol monooxygenase YgiN
MDDVIAYARDEVLPALQGMSGCVGMSMLCDRDGGRCIITSAWADETAMHASEQSVVDFRRRAAELMGGEYDTQVWEIAVMHRLHDSPEGACTRVIWGRRSPEQMGSNLEDFRMVMLPRMEELPGFCSVSLMVDRDSGRTVTSVTYASADMMRQADAMADAMREQFARAVAMDITDMAEMELVLHHLRVPETV